MDGNFAFCSFTSSMNQCLAPGYCNKSLGWNLCPASKYMQQYGTNPDNPPPIGNTRAWIAGCIRDGGGAQLPSDMVCSDCALSRGGNKITLAWDCKNGNPSYSNAQIRIGLVTSSTCNRVGDQINGQMAHWSPWGAVDELQISTVVCCK
jgi:hypothetical protein